MKIRVIRKNKRRIDPRYFLHENVEAEEAEAEEEGTWPPSITPSIKDGTKDEQPADLRALTLPEEDKAKLWSVIKTTFKNKPHVSLNDIKGAFESAGLQLAKEEQ